MAKIGQNRRRAALAVFELQSYWLQVDLMDLDHVIERMTANARIFESLTQGLTTEQARWKPAPDKWSILEVVNHLYDEEREDFRQRLHLVLTDAALNWPPIAPQQWVTARAYSERFGQYGGQTLTVTRVSARPNG
ncbi:MAG: DinB family protein, partial [Pyrinomonadaceae bacterium]